MKQTLTSAKWYFLCSENTIFRTSSSVMFNVREMLLKSGGLKVLRRPRILLLGSACTLLGSLSRPGVDRLFGRRTRWSFPRCFARASCTLPELCATACSPDCLSRNALKTLSTLGRARPPRPLSCALRSLLFIPETGLSVILSPAQSQKSGPWLSHWAARWRRTTLSSSSSTCGSQSPKVSLSQCPQRRMPLRTRHYQVGSHWGFSIADASRKPTLPGWQ